MAKKKKCKLTVDKLALILVIIGGLNWGLVGFFNWNLVYVLFGTGLVAKIVYDLVGLSALYMLIKLLKK